MTSIKLIIGKDKVYLMLDKTCHYESSFTDQGTMEEAIDGGKRVGFTLAESCPSVQISKINDRKLTDIRESKYM